jgi:hypothetical protein
VARLKESRGIALSLTALYEAPTIERLARRLEGTPEASSEIEASGRRGEARAEAMAQRRQARRR